MITILSVFLGFKASRPNKLFYSQRTYPLRPLAPPPPLGLNEHNEQNVSFFSCIQILFFDKRKFCKCQKKFSFHKKLIFSQRPGVPHPPQRTHDQQISSSVRRSVRQQRYISAIRYTNVNGIVAPTSAQTFLQDLQRSL